MDSTAYICPSPLSVQAHNLSLFLRNRQPNPNPRSTFCPPRQ